MIPPDVDNKEVLKLYKTKAADSFRTRFDLLLFKRILENNHSEIENKELDAFRIEENTEILTKYINIYWQEENYDTEDIDGIKIDDIYHGMKKWREQHFDNMKSLKAYYVGKIFNEIFPYDEFTAFVSERHKCDYCDITKEKINALINKKQLNKKKHTRGWSLEIDRKEPNLEYTRDNCVWCCYWCNNAKTDEFSYDEFKKIGSVIKSIWDERLGR
jgi:hypothetical protein